MNKKRLRETFLAARFAITEERRREATVAANAITSEGLTLSYCAFRGELDLSSLNRRLAEENRLALPGYKEGQPAVYLVTDIKQQLEPSKFGFLMPKASTCQRLALEEITTFLVPAIAFDQQNHRLGYGSGYYDQLLSKYPNALTIGIGFREQQIESLPFESHDQRLTKLALF